MPDSTIFYSQQLVCAGSKNSRKLELGSILCRSPSLTPCSTQSKLLSLSKSLRSWSKQVLSIAKDRDYSFPLHNQCQRLDAFVAKNFFLVFQQYFLCCNLWPLPFVFLQFSSKKPGAVSPVAPIKQLTTITTPLLPSLQAKQIQFPQPLLMGSTPQSSC